MSEKSTDARQVAEHISQYLNEMTSMARAVDLDFLAYLLDMARQEAVASSEGVITQLDRHRIQDPNLKKRPRFS